MESCSEAYTTTSCARVDAAGKLWEINNLGTIVLCNHQEQERPRNYELVTTPSVQRQAKSPVMDVTQW